MTHKEGAQAITAPFDDNLCALDFGELFVMLEFRSVLKIKLLFFKFVEQFIGNVLKKHSLFETT